MKRALTSLPSDLSPRLLQGVPLSTCLSGCGQHWAAPSQYTDDFYATRRFCRRTENFDVFLSHDWGTSRWLKLCSLAVMFNVRAASNLRLDGPAFPFPQTPVVLDLLRHRCFTRLPVPLTKTRILSICVGIAVGLLRAFGVIPDEKWTEAFPLAAFYSLLFFWQHLRELFLRPLVVFLDRLCIAQHDDKLKEQGAGCSGLSSPRVACHQGPGEAPSQRTRSSKS